MIQGHRRFLLFSEDIGSYGTDIGTTIAVLLQKIFSTPGDYKTSIRAMNPMWLLKYRDLSKILLANSDRIDYVTIPIQSGSSRILKLMNRYSNNGRLKNLFKTLTPHMNVRTMIIVGFPGETEKDFQATLDFVKEVKFAYIQIFAYCDRPGTKSSKMPHKIAARTIYHRIQRLQKAQQLFGTCQVKWF